MNAEVHVEYSPFSLGDELNLKFPEAMLSEISSLFESYAVFEIQIPNSAPPQKDICD